MAESRVLYREFKALKRREGELFDNLTMCSEDLGVWRFELRSHHFDPGAIGTRELKNDLKKLNNRHNVDHILVECSFRLNGSAPFPTCPPLIRVVRPRMKWYTGHVTSGGSFCTEMLVNTKGLNGWRSNYRIEAVIQALVISAVHCPVIVISTPYNGRQVSGPLRVDLSCEYTDNVLREYSEYEAVSAFTRAEAHHRRQGW